MAENEALRHSEDVEQASKFIHFLRSFRALFGRAFAAVRALQKARESGEPRR